MKYVVLYQSAEGILDKVPQHLEEHRALWRQFGDEGTLLMVGPFVPPQLGALSVFTTREAAERFVANDPFVIHGLVSHWEIREWNEVLA